MRRDNLTIYIITLMLMTVIGAVNGQNKIIDGQWRTTLGAVNLTANGSRVSGVYEHAGNKGEISGRYSWRTRLVSGRWNLEGKEGRFIFQAFSDGSGFLGEWWSGDSLRGGDWIGVRDDKNWRQVSVKASAFGGRWATNYGNMTISTDGLKAAGQFTGTQNHGSFSGNIIEETNRLVAQWKDEKHSGKVIWHLIKGGKAIIGEWWYNDNEYGGFWYGTRPVSFDGCMTGDCSEGMSTYIWADGSRYEGQWKNGVFHGEGTSYDPYGRILLSGVWTEGIYIGKCVKGDCIDGTGTIVYRDNTHYEGELTHGFPEGQGKAQTADSSLYKGTFKNGLPNGEGVLEWGSSGEEYNGFFGLGKMQGKGLYQFADDGKYDGQFRRGSRFGKGIMMWPNGDWYEGEWQNDQMSGEGTYVFQSGDRYVGHFEDNKRSGQGVYRYSDGRTLEGQWKDDQPVANTDGINAGQQNQSMAPEDIRATLPPRRTRSFKNENTYLVYEVVPTAQPTFYREGEQESKMIYFILISPKSLSRSEVKSIIEAKTDFVLVNTHRVEKTEEPLLRLQKVYRRYSGGLSNTRLNLTEGGIITLTESAVSDIVKSEPLSQ